MVKKRYFIPFVKGDCKQAYLFLFLLSIACFSRNIWSVEPHKIQTQQGEVIIEHLENSPFPHKKREDGYTFQNKHFSKEEHYSDPSVYIFIPKGIDTSNEVNLFFYFHGWNDNLLEIPKKYEVQSQFYQSKRNAILVIPQGPINAPDSFWGNLEEKNGFSRYIDELLQKLFDTHKIKTKMLGKIILSCHSGGYRVVSYILTRGGLLDKIQEVYIFDGLYGELEKYVYWLFFNDGKLVSIYTQNESTGYQTQKLIEDLEGWKRSYIFKKETELTNRDIQNNKIILISSNKTHNTVMYQNLKKILINSKLPPITRKRKR